MQIRKPNRKVKTNKMSHKSKTSNKTVTVKCSKNPKELKWIDKLLE